MSVYLGVYKDYSDPDMPILKIGVTAARSEEAAEQKFVDENFLLADDKNFLTLYRDGDLAEIPFPPTP